MRSVPPRELPQRFDLPAVVLFYDADGLLTLALVHRHPNQRKPKRNVLSHRVSLIRELHPLRLHRAHRDILAGLSLAVRAPWMSAHCQPADFDALATQELKPALLSPALGEVGARRRASQAPHNQRPAEHLLRWIVRLLFLWLLQEKNLAAENLFI